MTRAQAVVLRETGGPEVMQLEEVDLPPPEAGQILIRNEAIGLNFIDVYYRSGLYPAPLPSGLGNEAAGVVEAVGPGVSGFGEGDRVGVFVGPLGAYATHRLIDQDKVVKLPDAISSEAAAASMLKGCTAEYLIERCARVTPGQAALVHAAAGGVGQILVQWLKAIGATVIAHTGSKEKAQIARDLGADLALSCPFTELAEAARAFTDGEGVAAVFDGVGAASWDASLASLERRGLLASYGNASGPVPPFSPLVLSRAGSLFLTRPTLFDYCATPEEMRASAARLFALMEAGQVKVEAGRTFALADAADAHRALEARETTGSTLLLP